MAISGSRHLRVRDVDDGGVLHVRDGQAELVVLEGANELALEVPDRHRRVFEGEERL